MKLTTTSIRRLELPPGVSDRIYFDDDVAGFGLRLRAGGSKGWLYQYDIAGKTRRLTLGSIKALDAGKARDTAKDLAARVRLGEDPATAKLEQRARANETFGAFLPKFLARQQQRLRPNSFADVVRYLNQYARPWHHRPVSKIDQRDAAILVAELADRHGATTANRARSAVSAYFTWLIAEGLVDSNPISLSNRQVEAGPRQRVLPDSELAAVWKAAGDDQYGAIIKLLILTAARRDEIGWLRWSEYNDGVVTIDGERMKNKRTHVIPLSMFARAILEGQPRSNHRDYIFGRRDNTGYSGWTKSKVELVERLGVNLAHFTVHDLRRSAATGMAELGIEPHIIEAVLGHVGGHKSGVAGIYNVASYATQKAAALQRWSDHIEALVS